MGSNWQLEEVVGEEVSLQPVVPEEVSLQPVVPGVQPQPAVVTSSGAQPNGPSAWLSCDLPVIIDWPDEQAGANSDSLGAALRAVLCAEYAVLPLVLGGKRAVRAALRLLAALFAAFGGTVALRFFSEDLAADVTITGGIVGASLAWVLIEVEGLLQYAMRRQQLRRNMVSEFEADQIFDIGSNGSKSLDVTLSEMGAPWATIEEGDNEVESLAGSQGPTRVVDAVGEQLLHDFERLAPPCRNTAETQIGSGAVKGTQQAVGPGAQETTDDCTRVALPRLISAGSAATVQVRPIVSHNAPSLPPGIQGNGGVMPKLHGGAPMAKTAGDVGCWGAPQGLIGLHLNRSGNSAGTVLGRPSSSGISQVSDSIESVSHPSQSDKSSQDKSSAGVSYSSAGKSTGRSIVSIISVSRNAPTLHVKQPCDFEALKLRYIQSITTAKQEAHQADRRLDHDDVTITIAALEGSNPSLLVTAGALGVAFASVACALSVACFSVAPFPRRGLAPCWAEATAGWLLAVLALDLFVLLLMTSLMTALHWRQTRQRLEARRDHRWLRVQQLRSQKAAAMRQKAAKRGPVAAG